MKYKVTENCLAFDYDHCDSKMTGMLNESFTIDRAVVYLATVLV